MQEDEHVIEVLNNVKKALQQEDAALLSALSNQTIHAASMVQDAGSITLAVLVYSLSKIIYHDSQYKIRHWARLVQKFNSYIDLCIAALQSQNIEAYERHLLNARKVLTTTAVNLKPYIADVLRKASINKASKMYEHGISMGQTSALLGISQWELSEYTGQKSIADNPYNETLDIKKRARMALEFFS